MLIAGSDSNPKEFNEALIGANVDDVKTVTWTDEVEEGEEAETHTVEVTVKGIKVRNTPELTDELVKSDFGFDSIDAMRDAIKIEIEQDKASRLPAEKENRCVSALAERLQLDEMDADYEQSVFEELGQNFLSNLAARGMTLDTWLPASGLTMEQFIGDLHKQANDVAVSPWLWTPSPVSSRSRSPRTTSTPSSRRPASRTSRLPRPSSSPMAACLPSASPSVAPRPSTTWSRTPR